MTPANPDALAEALARELARLDGWQDPDALWTDNIGIIARGGEGSPVYLDYVEDAGKLIAGPLAPILADLQRVTAERDDEQAEDERFAIAYTTARGAVDYEHMARVLSGRLRRMDRRAAAANRRADNAEARAAQLQAEVEELKGALKVFADMDAMDPPEGVPLNEWLPAVTGARAVLRSPHTPASGALKIEEADRDA